MTGISARFGQRIRAVREQNQWTYREAATVTGVAASSLCRIERGEIQATLETAERIATGLGVPLTDLIAPAGCARCFDAPPPGFTCRACGAEGPEADEAAYARGNSRQQNPGGSR